MKIKAITLYTVFACIMLTFFCPYNTLTAEASENQIAYSESLSSGRSAAIGWRYKIIDGAWYKRLFDYSTDTWVGDWIYVKEA